MSMILYMQEAENFNTLDFGKWDFAFIGDSVDDRGDEAFSFSQNNSSKIIQLVYNANDMELSFDDKAIMIDDLEEEFDFIQNKKVLIEATTLNFAELLLLLKHIKLKASNISILYLEPKSYTRINTEPIIHRREFELSGETLGYIPIPGFSGFSLEDTRKKGVFIAGFEAERIDRGIEETSLSSKNCSIIFGVPAFQPGWEINSFANNIRVIKEQRMEGEMFFGSANNPGAFYDLLEKIYDALFEDEELYIAPVGPKPAGIATAIFAVEKEDINILYDHPKQKKTRSSEIGMWHLYNLSF